MDYYAWGMVREAAPYIVGLSALCILLWVLAPLALHWGHRKPRRKVEDVMRTWPVGTKDGMRDADR